VLSVANMNKSFQTDGGDVDVIRDLNLEIEKGEFAVIMGSSGSGKSSLLYLLCGLDQPNDGSIMLDGTELHGLNEEELAVLRRDGVGFVFQDFNLVGHLTLLENILVAGYLGRGGKKDLPQRARHLMGLVGIENLADRLPSRVSGGEQQRCAIARALINMPPILMADEPTGNLSSAVSTAVLDLFNTIHKEGQTIVLVTHELKAACRGERVLFMRDGAILDNYRFDADTAMIDREIALFQWLSERGW